jgi:molybdopterin-containing oxidoreductase family iron-sulfur binding subunit
MDLSALQARMAGQSGKTWWRGLDELADTPEFREMLHREFPEAASEFDDPAGRRSFLKLMGASLALAGASACTRIPQEKIVPYVRAPEEVVPGRPLFYATAMPFAGAATPVLVESHMGRPTKIEPNPEHPATRGGTDVAAQAAVLSLYDPDRAQAVKFLDEIRPWSQFLTAIQSELMPQKAKRGAGLRLLTDTVVSPTLADQIASLLEAHPGAKWIQWDPASRANARAGAIQAFAEDVQPIYHFDRASVVLSLDADFLNAGPGRLRYTRDFIDRRRLVKGHATMNRLYAAESTPTGTGIKADHRFGMRAVDVEGFARAVAAGLGVTGVTAPSALPASTPAAVVAAIVKDLKANRGAAVVVAGDQQPASVHALAHAMNEALGAAGQTVTYTRTVEARSSDQLADLTALAADMDAGRVDLLVIAGTNPVYTAPPGLKFAERMGKVRLRVYMGLHEDETAAHCQWTLPETHFLEQWSDARAYDGTVSIVQPLIAPLYEGRSPHELMAVLSGKVDATPHALVRDFWKRQADARSGAFGPLAKADGSAFGAFEDFWRQAVHDGFIAGSAFAPQAVALKEGAAGTASAPVPADALEVTFRPCPNVHDGRFANNGWLQELPRPVTKLVWDNVALVSPATAQRLGLLSQDLVTFRAQDRSVKVPVWVLPGQPDNSLMVTIGYGRTRAGRVGTGVGVDVGPLRPADGRWAATGVEVLKNGERHQLACTQGHFAIENRYHVRAGVLEQYAHEPEFAHHMAHTPDRDMTLHDNEWSYEGYAWGMSIDLNACTGCNACVVACQAENNIPVVGKDQVWRQREMHWLRIDRYYTGDANDPKETYFQPMACHHCENAPCEVVCPVAATTHGNEGLNDMVYNRCVGTRYCSHNCPYKVRRFNFLLYSDWTTPSLQMQRNPDVTVRSRGVMEKCTYCVQRINWARIDAKREDRQIRDGEIVTACEGACPAKAIVFGDVNDAGSRVTALKKEPRSYGALAELNVRPRTTYLAAVRNPNPEIEPYVPHADTAHGKAEHGDSVTFAPPADGGELTAQGR